MTGQHTCHPSILDYLDAIPYATAGFAPRQMAGLCVAGSLQPAVYLSQVTAAASLGPAATFMPRHEDRQTCFDGVHYMRHAHLQA